ncbi:mannose-1-phosphate guanylyltransferase/mannose-6-phosphate isomerase [Solimonas terrae]|uniref:mannose-1-phosphate guanylyltransferase n=1 Tax=Solimonas terrae TaxID=1396819 RepID=A0A6M2BQP2_9GAMM|nr:mannose-1-phosphate guanylyltransferase/mannose-6-phosphate isomerase [Solimonas terrae]NGY04531.1 mannose-1-phosphate guanylyltransferase/mannose-6-phosphate isomerase [Solimonas terrae]
MNTSNNAPIRILPVLLAGGSGTRLWPQSREQYPKQFLNLIDDKSLLQNTALRAARIPGSLPPLVICGDQHRFIAAEQLRQIGMTDATIILEPTGRNTAPAAAVAAHFATEKYGEDVAVFLMAADHTVRDNEAFVRSAIAACGAASSGHIVTFGVVPTRAETGYGYLKRGTALDGDAYQVAQFVEKPDLETARKFIADGDYLWNGGLFVFRANVFLGELTKFEPGIAENAENAYRLGKHDLDFIRLHADSFQNCRSDSIDYAVMEKTALAALVTMDAGWDDVGSWEYLAALPPSDNSGNVARGDVFLEGSRNNLISANSRLVSLIGVENHVVVETADAVLIASRDHTQDVKKIVQRLKASGRSEAQVHPRVYRPWGWYETIALAGRFQVKRIMVKPGAKLSLQMHHHRAEHWIVVSGTAQVTIEDKVFLLSEDQSTYIPLGNKHRLDNSGKIPLEIIEVQTGSYVGEDDIVRFEDIYGR